MRWRGRFVFNIVKQIICIMSRFVFRLDAVICFERFYIAFRDKNRGWFAVLSFA